MQQYLDLLDDVLTNGKRLSDPKGLGNLSVLGRHMRFNMADGFPLITTKKVNFSYVMHELLWFLSGETRMDYLKRHKVPIWDPWATKEKCAKYSREAGDLGPIYGYQWRHWQKRDGGEIDQIRNLINEINLRKYSKRMIVTAWNPEDVEVVTIAPCHVMFKCYIEGNNLSLHLFQRAADVFIGVPYNIASYALLLYLLAQVTNLQPKELVYTTSDTHLYINCLEQVRLQLQRSPRLLPSLQLNKSVRDIFKFTGRDIKLVGYDPHPFIKAPVAI